MDDSVRENPIEDAAREGDLAKLKELVTHNDFDAEVLAGGCRAAAESSRWQAFQYLIRDAGAPIHSDDVGPVALQYAALSGRVDIVKMLVELGVSLQSRAGKNALMAAATNGHLELLEYVASNGADIVSTGGVAACAAAKLDHWREVALLVNAGADLVQESVGVQLMALATTRGQEDVVEALLARGVALNPEVATAALKHMSSTYEWDKCRDAARYLVTSGAASKSEAADATLVTSAMFGDFDMITCLVSHGVEIATEAGGRALANAGLLGGCLDGDVQTVIRFLKDKGAVAPQLPTLELDEDF